MFYKSPTPHSKNFNVPTRRIIRWFWFDWKINMLYNTELFWEIAISLFCCMKTHFGAFLSNSIALVIFVTLRGDIVQKEGLYTSHYIQNYIYTLYHKYCPVYHKYSGWQSGIYAWGCKITVEMILSRGDNFWQICWIHRHCSKKYQVVFLEGEEW